MNPSKKGWLKQFIDYKKLMFKTVAEHETNRPNQPQDQSFYNIIQPTGMMYGYPVAGFGFTNEHTFTESDKTKILFLDNLLNSAGLYSLQRPQSETAYEEFITKTLERIVIFYTDIYPQLNIKINNWYGKQRNLYVICEEILDSKMVLVGERKTNFWSYFFTKSQLFLDIYVFGQWTYTNPDRALLDFFKNIKEGLYANTVKVMAAAAHANKRIEEEERSLFEYFIATTCLSADKKRNAHHYFEHGMVMSELAIKESESWIIKKYFFEIAALTVWSDKKMEQSEQDFLTSFNSSLGFSHDDYEESMIAVEGFILQNWRSLEPSMKQQRDYGSVSEKFLERLITITKQYLPRIELMIAQDRQLIDTLRKGAIADLKSQDKNLVRSKLLAVLQSIPNFKVILLPDEFLTLDNLLRIIPIGMINRVLFQV